jgi:hypothetical protein
VATDISTGVGRQALAGVWSSAFGRQREAVRALRLKIRRRPPRLALALTLTAAPQFVERPCLTSSGCARTGTTITLTLFSALLSACHLASSAPPLSAGTLLREYQQSSTGARRKYDGKEISVRGLALSAAALPRDGADEGSVWLQESDLKTSGKIGCWFSSQQTADFSRIVSGQHLTIKGVFNGEAGIDLKFCRLVKVE